MKKKVSSLKLLSLLLMVTAVGCGKKSMVTSSPSTLNGTTPVGIPNTIPVNSPSPPPSNPPTSPTPPPPTTTPTPPFPPFPPLPPPPPPALGPCSLQITRMTVGYAYPYPSREVTIKMLLGNILNAINYRVNDGGVFVIPAGVQNGPIEITATVPYAPGANTIRVRIHDVLGNENECSKDYFQNYNLGASDQEDHQYLWNEGFALGDLQRVIVGAGAGNTVGYWYLSSAKVTGMPPLVGPLRHRISFCEENEVMVGRKHLNSDAWVAANDIYCRTLDPRLELYSPAGGTPTQSWVVGARAFGSYGTYDARVLVGFVLARNATFGIKTAYIRWKQNP